MFQWASLTNGLSPYRKRPCYVRGGFKSNSLLLRELSLMGRLQELCFLLLELHYSRHRYLLEDILLSLFQAV